MQLFQHRMRTSQHVKSVQNIMTRTSHQFHSTKINFKKLSPQSDNISTYLRKCQIKKENQNLAKRIQLCESQHSRQRYTKQWENIKRFMKVRSNFKKTLFTKQPKIFKFQPILGKGKLKADFKVSDIEMPLQYWSGKNMYKLQFKAQNTEIEPQKKLLMMEMMRSYETIFYVPLFFRRKQVECRIIKVQQLQEFEVGKFEVDFSNDCLQRQVSVVNRFGKKIGKIVYHLTVQDTLRKKKKTQMIEKQNLPFLISVKREGCLCKNIEDYNGQN